MTDSSKGLQKPSSPGQGGSKQQGADDFPHIPTILQHSADKDTLIYRGSDKGSPTR